MFDMPPDVQGYPCDHCGGSIEFAGAHPAMADSHSLISGTSPSCCNTWECQKCGRTFYEHDFKRSPEPPGHHKSA